MSHSKKSIANAGKKSRNNIIEAIDSLKSRKSRPDEERICSFVEKTYGMRKADAVKAISEAVADGTILKVKFKDSVSYRNPKKFNALIQTHVSRLDNQSSAKDIIKRVLRELRSLTRSNSGGASVRDLMKAMHENHQLLNFDESRINQILLRAVDMGSARLLPSGNYVLAGGKRIVPRRTDPDQSASTSKLFNDDHFHIKNEKNSNDDGKESVNDSEDDGTNKMDDGDMNEEGSTISDGASTVSAASVARKRNAQIMTRARPFSKRKKFKKSHGPDFLEPSELGLQYLRDTYEPKCDYCQSTAVSNVKGENEDLLVCKDCSAKAHPSCMDYSKELADRSRRSPWQCMDCKTCAVCEDSGDGDCMLVCDMCDKGYHMNCHVPPVKQKPNGKWACKECNDMVEMEKSKSPLNESAQMNEETKLILENETNKKAQKTQCIKKTQPVLTETKDTNGKECIFDGYPNAIPNPQNWTPEDVQMFIEHIGFPEQSHFFKEQEIDGSTLLLMRRSDVLRGFEIKLGPALKIYSHILRLQKSE